MLRRQVNSRLAVPPLPPRHISRPRLVAALDDTAGLPLVLLSAGPGAGKTVLLTDWVLSQEAPVAWITATAANAEPRRFWRLLWSAFRAFTEPSDDPPTVMLRAETIGLSESLLESMPGLPAPPILVIDDAHQLVHPDVLDGLDTLIQGSPPPRVRLVLAARSDPLLPLHRYRLAGQMRELRASDLAMTRDEMLALLSAHGITLPREDSDALLVRTEGWTAGVRLSAMRMEGRQHPARFLSELAFGQGSIGEYLMTEVLDCQPAPIRRLLVETSFLDEVTGPLADAVTGIDGCAELLRGLARSNSFVIPVDAAWTRFRYHQLFAEVLRHELRLQAQDAESGMMQRAAAYFQANGDVRSAMQWAVKAGNLTSAASLLLRGGLADAFVNHEDLAGPGIQALQQLPVPGETDAGKATELALARDAAAAATADPQTAERRLQVSHKTAGEQPADPDAVVTAGLVQLLLVLKAGDMQAVDSAADHLLTQLGTASGHRTPGLPAAILLAQASTHFWHGRNQDVDALLQAALTAAEREKSFALELEILAMLALVDSLLSRPHRAEDATARAYAVLHKHDSLTIPPALHLAVAGRSLMAADLTSAGRALQLAQNINDKGFSTGLADAHAIGQATFLLTNGSLSEARAVLDGAVSRTNLPLLRLLRETLIADIETALGRPRKALQLLEQYRHTDLAVLTALPAARAFLSLHDLPGAQNCARSILASPSTLISRYTLAETMLLNAQIAQLQGDTGRALEMISGSIDLAQNDIVLPFSHLRNAFAPLLSRHPAVAARWPRPPASQPVDTVAPGVRAIAADLPSQLTAREHAILRLLATNLTTAEIAGELCISITTVRTHIAAIYRKLTASKRREAVLRARKLELI